MTYGKRYGPGDRAGDDEDDVQGHFMMRATGASPDEHPAKRSVPLDDDDDDVAGHMMGAMKATSDSQDQED